MGRRAEEGPPTAFAALGWLGKYLTDEEQVVQVVGVQPEGLACQNIATEKPVFVEFDPTTGGIHWRDVTPKTQEAA